MTSDDVVLDLFFDNFIIWFSVSMFIGFFIVYAFKLSALDWTLSMWGIAVLVAAITFFISPALLIIGVLVVLTIWVGGLGKAWF